MMSLSKKRITRGFTLIELMIVVVIMGILSAIAIYSVRSYVQQSKTAEAREVIATIMAQQEAFFDETGQYLNVTGGVTTGDFYPAGGFDGRVKIQWGGADGCSGLALDGTTAVSCDDGFKTLGVMVNQPVMFRYAVTTFAAGSQPPVTGTHVTQFNPGSVNAPRDGYIVVALSDLNGDGGEHSAVVGSSIQADLYSENLGE